MHFMPILLRQSLRSSIHFTKSTSRPVQAQFRLKPPSAYSVKPTPRSFSVCLQCQFRRRPGLYSSHDEKDKASLRNDAERLDQAMKDAPDVTFISQDAGGDSNVSTAGDDGHGGHSQGQSGESSQSGTESNGHTANAQRGGLPSYLESRRSQVSKQFTSMMDNLQSNVFVAGQRLNDLTGYSGIEALKKDIQSQGTTLPPPTFKSQILIQHSKQRPTFVTLALKSAKPKTNTQPPSTAVPPPNAKSTSFSNANTPGPRQTWNDSRFSIETTIPTKSPRQKRRKRSRARNAKLKKQLRR